MNPLFILLGIVDIFAASIVLLQFSETVALYMMVYMLAKGGYFLILLVTTKNFMPLYSVLSLVDIATGVALGAIALGVQSEMFFTIGIVSMVKGAYSTVSPFLS